MPFLQEGCFVWLPDPTLAHRQQLSPIATLLPYACRLYPARQHCSGRNGVLCPACLAKLALRPSHIGPESSFKAYWQQHSVHLQLQCPGP